jgi:hypothetical protein
MQNLSLMSRPAAALPSSNNGKLLTQFRNVLEPDMTPRSIEEQLEQLSEEQRQQILTFAQLAKIVAVTEVASKGYLSQSYLEIVRKVYPGGGEIMQQLIAAVLDEIAPIVILDEKQKLQAHKDHQLGAIYDQKHQIDISGTQADTATPDERIDSFMRKMAMSESSGDPNAEITHEDGRTFAGLYQFGDARLSDYRKATGAKFTTLKFKEDEALQQKVADWHFADIQDAIDALGSEADGYDRDGLMAVAHLGGVGGMKRYVRTKGQYNPSDALGTSLSDYYAKFSA